MNDKSNEANHIQETTKNSMQDPPIGYLEILEDFFSRNTSRDSMQEPSAEVKAKIDELLADDPRLKYPYMSRHEYRKMMDEREKK